MPPHMHRQQQQQQQPPPHHQHQQQQHHHQQQQQQFPPQQQRQQQGQGPPDEEWFYRDDAGAKQGPFSAAQMQHWLGRGVMPLSTPASCGSSNELRPVGDFRDLLPPQLQQQLGPPPPNHQQHPRQMQPPPSGQMPPHMQQPPFSGQPGFQQHPGQPPFGGGPPPGGGGGGGGGGQWGGPRPEPPRNPEIKEKIEKLVDHIRRLNPPQGAAMEAKVRENTQNDPSFGFLRGGDGSDYFRSLLS
jgi:hypothetical protein